MKRAKYLNQDPERGQPEEISGVIGEVLEQVTSGGDTRQGAIVDEWDQFAPGDWAPGSPVGVKDGVLLVEVPNGAIASLVKYQVAALIREIDRRFGAGVVTGVRVSVARPATSRKPR